MKNNYLKIHPDDNVAVALQNLEKGDFIFHEKERISLITPIPAKGKVALIDFSIGDFIFMYGIIVGKATTFISRGEWLGVHNVIHEVSSLSEWKEPFQWTPPTENRWENKYFMGYHRADGSVGTANHWLVIPLVFCENRNVLMLKEAFDLHLGFRVKNPYEKLVEKLVHNLKQGDSRSLSRSDISEEVESDKVFKNISGIKFLTHDGGCGGTREDSEMLCRLIAGYIANPNVGGATILSLGCQHAQIHLLKEILQEVYPRHQKPVLYFEQQKYPSETVMMQEIIEQTFEEVKKLNSMERKPAPLSQLVMGVECGGSDGFSGLSANPSMGYCADLLVMNGGSVILSEFPELCGVEQDFVNRSLSGEIAKKFVNLMRNYDERAKSVGSGFDMNPSPGNIKDGLITDAIKSAGAAKKGGTSPVVDVLDYTEPCTHKGLNLLCTPGNDVESTTGLAGSGANIILFSTGLGTPTGNPVSPVIKISTNTSLRERMTDIIDYDCGTVITGEKTVQDCGAELLDLVIEVASGNQVTKAEQLEQNDFIPWKRGVSL